MSVNHVGLIKAHELAGVARKQRSNKEQAGRALSDADIRAVWLAAHDAPAIRLLLLTGCRRSEWSDATRAEINADDRTLNITANRYKTKIDFILPLVPAAWEIVEALPDTGDGLFGPGDAVESKSREG